MSFTTLTFFAFLAIVFVLHWSTRNRTLRNLLLTSASFVFYATWDWRFAVLMFLSCSVDYFVSLGLVRTKREAWRRILLGTSLLFSLGLLVTFKYFNFFASNLQELLNAIGWQTNPVLLKVVLPVGISFYTFQTMSYTLDVYYGRLKPTTSILDYYTFLSFFPQLVAGPIERAHRLLGQFQVDRTFDYEFAREGCRQILWGLFKKMVIADNLAVLVDRGYRNVATIDGAYLAFATVAFAFQIYCDFSAYSDIARGTARLFGIDLMRNFAYPYFSQSVPEFWRRWHISLSTWFRDYVFIPLGGSRNGKARWIRNILITFVLSGLWHGASWNFIIWGALNGVAMVAFIFWTREGAAKRTVEELPGGNRFLPTPPVLLRMLGTFAFICLTWVFFRAATLDESLLILKKIVVDSASLDHWKNILTFLRTETSYKAAVIFVGLLLAVEWIHRGRPHPLHMPKFPRPLRWVIYTTMIYAILYHGTRNQSGFIYFQF